MRVVVYQKVGRDFPFGFLGDSKFIEEQKRTIARRLELRSIDTVEIIQEA